MWIISAISVALFELIKFADFRYKQILTQITYVYLLKPAFLDRVNWLQSSGSANYLLWYRSLFDKKCASFDFICAYFVQVEILHLQIFVCFVYLVWFTLKWQCCFCNMPYRSTSFFNVSSLILHFRMFCLPVQWLPIIQS